MSAILSQLLRRQALAETAKRAAAQTVKPKETATVTRFEEAVTRMRMRRREEAMRREDLAAKERVDFLRAQRRQKARERMRRPIEGGRAGEPRPRPGGIREQVQKKLARELTPLRVIRGGRGRPGRERPIR